MIQIDENVFQIPVTLPNSPLKILNSYVIKSNSRNLLIDTGYNIPECLESLRAGIAELELDMQRTDVLATHFHADHTGLISQIITPESRVFMGKTDGSLLTRMLANVDAFWMDAESTYLREGFPAEELEETRKWNPARRFLSEKSFEITPLDDGDTLRVGDREWKVIETPGHTPGHICLYEADKHQMITGDHLLFDITPNITWWKILPDSLGRYLQSLDKISLYDVDITLTGHRGIAGDFQARIAELKAHHAQRLEEVIAIVQEMPDATGYDIASRLHWSIRTQNWKEFPLGQKWFAVGEAIAHVNHLVLQRKLVYREVDGVRRYNFK